VIKELAMGAALVVTNLEAVCDSLRAVLSDQQSGQVIFCRPFHDPVSDARGITIRVNAVSKQGFDTLRQYPVRALDLYGGGTEALDFSCLRGLALIWLSVSDVDAVHGEEALTNMPLRTLLVDGTTCTNLAAISRIATLQTLWLRSDPTAGAVAMAPLARLSDLRELELIGPWGPDLAPLRQTTLLRRLSLTRNRCVSDFSPLTDLPLARLDLEQTSASNLSFVSGMHLSSLNISYTSVRDIGALKGVPLKELEMEGLVIEDVSVLDGMPLKRLIFDPRFVKKGLDALRKQEKCRIGTRRIGGCVDDDVVSAQEFWKKYDRGELGSGL